MTARMIVLCLFLIASSALAPAGPVVADAPQPAEPGYWLVEIDLALDGQAPSRRLVLARAGEGVDLAGGVGNTAWTAQLTLSAGPAPDKVLVAARIERDGDLVASPSMVASDAQPARLRLDDGAGAALVEFGVTAERIARGRDAVTVFQAADGGRIYVVCDGLGDLREAGPDRRLRCRTSD